MQLVPICSRLGGILCWIRSQHAAYQNPRDEVSLLKRLSTTRQLLQSSSVDLVRIQKLTEEVDNLQEQFDDLEDSYGQEANLSQFDARFLVLIEGIHSFFAHCKRNLRCIPYTRGVWSRNATNALIDRFRKIGQYITACDELLRATRRYKVFAGITIHFTDLQ
jgi:hypothetical protein